MSPFPKTKISVFEQPTNSQSGVITITQKSQLWVGDTEKLLVNFSHAWLILAEFT